MKFALVKASEELSAATTETLVQVVAGTDHQVKVKKWECSFAGITVTDEPIEVQLVRQSTAGTSSALTPVKWHDSDGDSIDATGRQDFTGEPTTGDILASVLVHPQGGYGEWFPAGDEVIVGGGDRVGIRVITPSGVNPDATAMLVCEE